jgi:hypothetical protein
MSGETLAQEAAYVEARRVLLDGLEALGSHRKAAKGGGSGARGGRDISERCSDVGL